jgi:RimJ/RimL family protein N-acetyltransferase
VTTLDGVVWPVRTERLVLRPATAADVESTWRFRRLESVSRWLTREVATLDEHRALFEDPAWLARTIVVELDGTVIGDLMVRVTDAWAQAEVAEQAAGVQAELGWVLDPEHSGHGYASEAVRALLRICFEDLGLRRVSAECFAANEASWRLMERVGMRREAHNLRDSLHRSGDWLDGMGYALLADEWRASTGR